MEQTVNCGNCDKNYICCGEEYNVSLTREEVQSGFFIGKTKMLPATENSMLLGYVLALRKKDGSCIFKNDETNKCEIYENRPKACKDFSCIGRF